MEKIKFSLAAEKNITKAIVSEFAREFLEYVESDVIIVGGGPSGLMAGRELAKRGVKTLIIEENNYIGGGFWTGGYLMNKLTFRSPAQEILDEINVPYKEVEEGLFVSDGPHTCSKLIAAACDAGVKIINMTKFDDVVLKNNSVKGCVINFTPVSSLPKAIACVDPVAIESKIVIDASGHDAVVTKALERRNLLKIPGFGAMDVVASESAIVENTKEIFPGLIVTGMAVATAFGLPRMGPTFGGMLLSGRRAAEIAFEILNKVS
ncbi:MAG: sulfide-dependent adenosine diphosphate thiazole synthase [Candidatus Altarchaeaceae archaeon]